METENCTPLAQTIDLAGQFNNEDNSNSEMNNWVPGSSNVVCVDEFGAKGDGENDDTKVNLHCPHSKALFDVYLM
jgi:hypothetical protein